MSENTHNAGAPVATAAQPASPEYDTSTHVPPDDPAPPSRGRTGTVAAAALALVVVTIGVVWLLTTRRSSALAAEGQQRAAASAAGPVVRTAVVDASPTVRTIELLGEAKPFASVTLYAKVAGYLKTLTVDVGDRVAAGATLATIESPETDRAFSAAKADYDNKQLTSSRVTQLLAKKLVSPQEADQAKTEASMANERLESLREQQGYESLRAPFAGRVTARFADPGALVQSAASSQTSALPVVTVSQVDRLRVFAYLDQADAAIARPGTKATISLPERPNDLVPATISRLSGELDPKTRKMLVELDLDNANGTIVPGSFVQVHLDFPQASRPEAPVEALLVRGGKTYVAVIDADARVHITPVVVATNDGRELTFASGVTSGDRVALNLGSAIADGDHVQIDKSSTATASSAAGTKK